MLDSAADELAQIVFGIRNETEGSEERLAAVLGKGIRVILARQVQNSSDVDQLVNECLKAVASAIRAAKLRDPDAVSSFAVTVTRQYAARLTAGPEHVAGSRQSESIDLHRRALLRLSPFDREILQRLYVQKEPEEEIRRAMGLTENQLQLRKSRAKSKLAQEVERLSRPSRAGRLLAWFPNRP